jgi:putative membrane protein
MKTVKTIALTTLFAVSSLTYFSCGPKKATDDATAVADEKNLEKVGGTKAEDDAKFVVEAADAGMTEVQLGQLTKSNSASPAVKDFGQMMIAEHGKANDELKALAILKNITLPTALSDESQKKLNELAGKRGNEFDKAYTELMVKGHKDVLDKFKTEADNGSDTDLRSWAGGKVSVLEHHLEVAESVKKAVH